MRWWSARLGIFVEIAQRRFHADESPRVQPMTSLVWAIRKWARFMKLSRTVTYALQATLLLAQSERGEPIPCSRLAAEGSMPERFLLQILRSLVTHGILQSTRGVEGGYTLDRTPDQISLLEIIEAVDGPLNTKLPFADCKAGECQSRLRDTLSSIAAAERQQLQEVKVAHLINPRQFEKQLTG
jgi:Rrf2 family protein